MSGYYSRTWQPEDGPQPDVGPAVVVWDRVFADVQAHARTDLANEVAGFLLGSTFDSPDGDRPVVVVEAALRARHVETGSAHVEFSHDTWAAFHEEREALHDGMRILGWYHTHPDIGLFLSSYDTFIHENFFKDADRIALVLDPVHDNAAFFTRVDGTLDPYRLFGFTELSGDAIGTLAPGANLALAEQAPAERSLVPSAALPKPEGTRVLGLPAPGIAELISLARRVFRRYWNEPPALDLRRLVMVFLGKPAPEPPSVELKGSALVGRDRGALLRELESAEQQLATEVQRQAAARDGEAAAVRGLAVFKREVAERAHSFAVDVALRLAWAIVGVGLLAVVVVALVVAPVPPLSSGGSGRWGIASALMALAVVGGGVSTASVLGPLSLGLAARLGRGIAARFERALNQTLRLD